MAGRRRVKIPELNQAIMEILEEYGNDVTESVKAAVLKTAEIAKQETKAASPYKPGKPSWHNRHYASGWTVNENVVDRFRTKAIIHNKKDYQRTHLLEKGHALRNGGRAQAFPHIGPAEQHAIKNFEEAVKKIAQEG